jgi:hypothetical protein
VENIGIADILAILCVLTVLLFEYSLVLWNREMHAFWSVTKSSSRPHYVINYVAMNLNSLRIAVRPSCNCNHYGSNR